MAEPTTEAGQILLMSGLTSRFSGRRLADNPHLVVAIEAEAREQGRREERERLQPALDAAAKALGFRDLCQQMVDRWSGRAERTENEIVEAMQDLLAPEPFDD